MGFRCRRGFLANTLAVVASCRVRTDLKASSAEFVPRARPAAAAAVPVESFSPPLPPSLDDEDYFIPGAPVFEWLLYENDDTASLSQYPFPGAGDVADCDDNDDEDEGGVLVV